MSRVFDRIAEVYDSGVEFFKPVGRRLVELLDLRPGQRVLDVGCGRGAVVFPAADAVGATGSVVGIDIVPAMVEQTRAEAARLGLATVTAMTADGAEPPFEPASFDVVTGSMSIIMLPDLPAVFSRYAGILRRPGRLGMTAPALPGDLRSWTLGPLDIGRVIREIPADAVARSPRLSRMLDGEPFGGFADLLRDAGFDPVTEHREDVELRASSARDLVDWTWTNGIRMFWGQIPQPRRSRLREELVAEVARAAGGSDTVTAGYPVSYLTAHL